MFPQCYTHLHRYRRGREGNNEKKNQQLSISRPTRSTESYGVIMGVSLDESPSAIQPCAKTTDLDEICSPETCNAARHVLCLVLDASQQNDSIGHPESGGTFIRPSPRYGCCIRYSSSNSPRTLCGPWHSGIVAVGSSVRDRHAERLRYVLGTNLTMSFPAPRLPAQDFIPACLERRQNSKGTISLGDSRQCMAFEIRPVFRP